MDEQKEGHVRYLDPHIRENQELTGSEIDFLFASKKSNELGIMSHKETQIKKPLAQLSQGYGSIIIAYHQYALSSLNTKLYLGRTKRINRD